MLFSYFYSDILTPFQVGYQSWRNGRPFLPILFILEYIYGFIYYLYSVNFIPVSYVRYYSRLDKNLSFFGRPPLITV